MKPACWLSGRLAETNVEFRPSEQRMSRRSRQGPLVSKERFIAADRGARNSGCCTFGHLFLGRGPDARLTWQSESTGIENKWFALTGRVVAMQVEADGDLHIALQDTTGDKPGIVVAEIPAKPNKKWCELRKI